MFILKGVKVVCFDTLLQVLILNDLHGAKILVRERQGVVQQYTPVVTGSMRNRVMAQGIAAPRDADDGGFQRLEVGSSRLDGS